MSEKHLCVGREKERLSFERIRYAETPLRRQRKDGKDRINLNT